METGAEFGVFFSQFPLLFESYLILYFSSTFFPAGFNTSFMLYSNTVMCGIDTFFAHNINKAVSLMISTYGLQKTK